jgi:hypothetical protein
VATDSKIRVKNLKRLAKADSVFSLQQIFFSTDFASHDEQGSLSLFEISARTTGTEREVIEA